MTAGGRPIALVTGAGGFIGSRLLPLLQREGYRVRAHLAPPGLPCAEAPEGVDAFVSALEDPGLRHRFHGVETVVHLAGPPGVAASFDRPADYAQAHVVGTAAVLEHARACAVRRFVYVSSAEVYGMVGGERARETRPPRPGSPYAAAKLGAEALVSVFARSTGFEAVIARPFSVYGPGANRAGLVPSILRALERREPIRVFDLRPVRDYGFVDDVALGLLRCATAPLPDRLSVFNLGSGVGTSVRALAETAIRVSGLELPIVERTESDRPTAVDVSELVADPENTRSGLGWQTTTSLEEGIAHMTSRGGC